jgi:hypothetical protein
MAYYPGWFDYAGWIFGITGILCWLNMKSEPAGRTRGFFKLAACLSIAAGVAFAATGGVLFNLRAPVLELTGEITAVKFFGGRNSQTRFVLLTPSGESRTFSISGEVAQISKGETAHLFYQQDSDRVRLLRITAGRSVGYQNAPESGLFGAWASLVGAVVLAGYGVLSWLNDRDATPSETADDVKPQLDGDVDTKSLLNLSKLD